MRRSPWTIGALRADPAQDFRVGPPSVALGRPHPSRSLAGATGLDVASFVYSGQPTLLRMSNWWARFTIRSRFPLRIAFLVMLMI